MESTSPFINAQPVPILKEKRGRTAKYNQFKELIWFSCQSLITLEYKRVKLKMLYMHCEATLNPMLDVIPVKRDRWQELKQNTN